MARPTLRPGGVANARSHARSDATGPAWHLSFGGRPGRQREHGGALRAVHPLSIHFGGVDGQGPIRNLRAGRRGSGRSRDRRAVPDPLLRGTSHASSRCRPAGHRARGELRADLVVEAVVDLLYAPSGCACSSATCPSLAGLSTSSSMSPGPLSQLRVRRRRADHPLGGQLRAVESQEDDQLTTRRLLANSAAAAWFFAGRVRSTMCSTSLGWALRPMASSSSARALSISCGQVGGHEAVRGSVVDDILAGRTCAPPPR